MEALLQGSGIFPTKCWGLKIQMNIWLGAQTDCHFKTMYMSQ